jgi:phospholipid-binding lipoprotein MlaA
VAQRSAGTTVAVLLLVLCGSVSAVAAEIDTPTSVVVEDSGMTPIRSDLFEDDEGAQLAEIPDPLEGWNRRVYAFNTSFDRRLFLPTVRGYKRITPDPVETGIWNFFLNVSEPLTFLHSMLQFKMRSAGVTLGRFLANTTLGIGGIFDPATQLGMARRSEDLGQTLGRYGVPEGPYLVLPVFGPSNARDTTGLIGDYALTMAAYQVIGLNDNSLLPLRLSLAGLRSVSTRANTAFRYHETGSPFEYELVRYLYTQLRRVEIQR